MDKDKIKIFTNGLRLDIPKDVLMVDNFPRSNLEALSKTQRSEAIILRMVREKSVHK